jgi:predicted ester cyclase
VAQNASIARSTYEAWNDRDFNRIAEVLAKGEVIAMGSGDRWEGSDGALQFAEMWYEGFPDGKIEFRSITETDDTVVIEFTGRGRHTGTLRSPMGDIEATGRPMELQLCEVWSFASDGTPTQVRTYFETASMMAQLGLLLNRQRQERPPKPLVRKRPPAPRPWSSRRSGRRAPRAA